MPPRNFRTARTSATLNIILWLCASQLDKRRATEVNAIRIRHMKEEIGS